jgi:hypothetical protein
MDWTPVLVGVIAAVPPTLLALATLIKQFRTHKTFNSKMDAMLALTRLNGIAEGRKSQRDEERNRQVDDLLSKGNE